MPERSADRFSRNRAGLRNEVDENAGVSRAQRKSSKERSGNSCPSRGWSAESAGCKSPSGMYTGSAADRRAINSIPLSGWNVGMGGAETLCMVWANGSSRLRTKLDLQKTLLSSAFCVAKPTKMFLGSRRSTRNQAFHKVTKRSMNPGLEIP